MALGGRRPGSGRRKGGKNFSTLEREVAEKTMRERILKRLHPLLNAQFALAQGLSYVFRISPLNQKAMLVTDVDEIREFLDTYRGQPGEVNGSYYYITVKDPDARAIDSMLDRVFGKAKQSVDMTADVKNTLDDSVKSLIEKAIDSVI